MTKYIAALAAGLALLGLGGPIASLIGGFDRRSLLETNHQISREKSLVLFCAQQVHAGNRLLILRTVRCETLRWQRSAHELHGGFQRKQPTR